MKPKLLLLILILLSFLYADSDFPVKNLKGHSGWVSSVSFSPDGKYLASGSGDTTFRACLPISHLFCYADFNVIKIIL